MFLSFSVMYSPLIVFFLGSVSFPLTLCFALLCHLSLLRLLLCVSYQVLDIIYDLVLCPDCETPDKTSISATNTKSVGSLLHPPLNHCVCISVQIQGLCIFSFSGIQFPNVHVKVLHLKAPSFSGQPWLEEKILRSSERNCLVTKV